MTSGTYYGDASGGKNAEYPDIRRVGVAFVKIDDEGNLTFGAQFQLVGEVQTVSRGELSALVELIKHVRHSVDIELVTDNKEVSDKYNAGPPM